MTWESQDLICQDALDQCMDCSIEETSRRIKCILESVLALLLLVVTMPILLVAMVLVWMTSRGSAVYAQQRLGCNGLVFTIYRIRTMYRDSEPNGARWCMPGDPQGHAGRLAIPLTHIDELPQLVNVLQGEMSLIGPRPERPEIARRVGEDPARVSTAAWFGLVSRACRRSCSLRTRIWTWCAASWPPTFIMSISGAYGLICGSCWPRCLIYCPSSRKSSSECFGFRCTPIPRSRWLSAPKGECFVTAWVQLWPSEEAQPD